MTEFQPEEILRVLSEHSVRYVLIGGVAANLHGAVYPTFDVDVTPETSAENFSRLSAALKDLDARIRFEGMEDGLPFAHDATSLAGIEVLNLVTRFGSMDISLHPEGVSTFSEWDAGATDAVVLGVPVRLAALEDVVRSKEAADRPKDRLQLPVLRALLRRLRKD